MKRKALYLAKIFTVSLVCSLPFGANMGRSLVVITAGSVSLLAGEDLPACPFSRAIHA